MEREARWPERCEHRSDTVRHDDEREMNIGEEDEVGCRWSIASQTVGLNSRAESEYFGILIMSGICESS